MPALLAGICISPLTKRAYVNDDDDSTLSVNVVEAPELSYLNCEAVPTPVVRMAAAKRKVTSSPTTMLGSGMFQDAVLEPRADSLAPNQFRPD